MADVNIIAAAPQVYVRCTMGLVSQGANSSVVRSHCYALVRNGTRYGTWDWNTYVGGYAASGSTAVNWGSGDYLMGYKDATFNHDVNGNCGAIGGSSWMDAYYGSGTAYESYTPPRIALAPTNLAPAGSLVKPTTARITASVSSHGHGTSSTYNIRYRLSGASTWTERGYGAATWDLTGLKPGKVYEMGSIAKNNNGDTNSWTTGTYTFKTKGIAGIAPLLAGIM